MLFRSESYKPNGEWIQGKKDGEDAHLVEYGTDDFRVQFYIADDDNEFCVIMIKRNGKNIENEDARCAAINQIYSSKLVTRIKLPMPVFLVPSGKILLPMTRGSKSSLNILPSATRFCFISSAFLASASMYMLLNL